MHTIADKKVANITDHFIQISDYTRLFIRIDIAGLLIL
jgi:hypothetical protein